VSVFASLFSFDGMLFGLRYLHILSALIWIGFLYYLNFAQTPFFAEADGPTKSAIQQKLLGRVLWWFRWGAFWTATFGILILGARGHQLGSAYFMSSRGINIMTGALLGLIMAANVWFVIWPAQKVVIQNALDVAGGKPANPAAATRGARASVASRTNVLFSIPMLFFMAAAVHLPFTVGDNSNVMAYSIAVLVVSGLIEGNALKGKLGPMATVKGVLTCGFALTVVFVGLLALFI
jgi:uncharacterized membrane protein